MTESNVSCRKPILSYVCFYPLVSLLTCFIRIKLIITNGKSCMYTFSFTSCIILYTKLNSKMKSERQTIFSMVFFHHREPYIEIVFFIYAQSVNLSDSLSFSLSLSVPRFIFFLSLNSIFLSFYQTIT